MRAEVLGVSPRSRLHITLCTEGDLPARGQPLCKKASAKGRGAGVCYGARVKKMV